MIKQIIDQLSNTPGKNDKIAILQSHKDNVVLKRLFELAYNPMINFWITAPSDVKGQGSHAITMAVLDGIYDQIAMRKVTGYAATTYLTTVMLHLTPDDAEVIRLMMSRDLNCKVAEATINKVWPGLIPSFPVMLAHPSSDKLLAPFTKLKEMYIQLKCDGGRMIFDTRTGVAYSRSGQTLALFNHFSSLSNCGDVVLDGELLAVDSNGNIQSRTVGNGLYTKAVRGTISDTEVVQFIYVIWDAIPGDEFDAGKGKTPYHKRWKMVQDICDPWKRLGLTMIRAVDHKVITSIEEAQAYFEEKLAEGEEGAMLKNPTAVWEDGRSKNVLKFKAELECSLECYGVTPHTKDPSLIGSLQCRTSDGLLLVDVGSGLTDELRKQPASYFVDQIINITYNAVIASKTKTTKSLFLPRMTGIRHDIKEADDITKIKG